MPHAWKATAFTPSSVANILARKCVNRPSSLIAHIVCVNGARLVCLYSEKPFSGTRIIVRRGRGQRN